MNSVGSKGSSYVIEGVRADAERLLMLLKLLQLLDDLAPHLLRHCGLDRVANLVQSEPSLATGPAVGRGIDQQL